MRARLKIRMNKSVEEFQTRILDLGLVTLDYEGHTITKPS